MTRQLTATQLKAQLLAVLDDVGAGEDVEITKHGRTIARLVPARGPKSIMGMFEGVVRSNASDEELFTPGIDWGELGT